MGDEGDGMNLGNGGNRGAFPHLNPPFNHSSPTLPTLCMGQAWVVHGFSHLLTTLLPLFLHLAWGIDGQCMASPTF